MTDNFIDSYYTGCIKKSTPFEAAAIQISRNLLH